MKHADNLINRILFLNGLPNVQRLNPIRVGEDAEQILKADMALEEKALNDLREGIAYCESVRDFVSRDLLLEILESEEEHVDFLDRQFDLIKQIGIERYVLLNAAAAPEQDDWLGLRTPAALGARALNAVRSGFIESIIALVRLRTNSTSRSQSNFQKSHFGSSNAQRLI